MTAHLLASALLWQPAAGAVPLAAAALLLAASLAYSWRGLRGRFGARRAWPPTAARGVAALLLLAALFDPSTRRVADGGAPQRLLVLLDRSRSMQVADDGSGLTRLARAERLVARVRGALPASVQVETWPFDSEVRRDGGHDAAEDDGTDLGAALLAAAEQAGDVTALLLLSDGGDETPRPSRLPRAALAVAAMGGDAAGWRDVSVAEVAAPPTVEQASAFRIEADLLARGSDDAAFRAGLGSVGVTLLRAGADGAWQPAGAAVADLSRGRARVGFDAACEEAGTWLYRVEAAAVPGELSPLNNRRTVRVEARREALDVLYFSRRLGADLKTLRRELASDPSLTFTALYRVGGERYTVQAGEGVDASPLHEGLPADVEKLRAFDCVIVGSFPAELWSAEEMRVLLAYVAAGGGLVWLGGDDSFDGGGYAVSPLAPLVPWRMEEGASTLQRGDFPVTVPLAAASDPAVAGLRELLLTTGEGGSLSVASVNRAGTPSPGALVLLEAGTPGGRVPLLVTQAYGRGRVLALGSNTSWQWSGEAGPAAVFYRRLWRQMVRAAAGVSEGGRVLQVALDRTELRPAERAVATVRVLEPAGLALKATLAGADGRVALALARGAAPDTWQVELDFRRRGSYLLRVEAERGGESVETYERTLVVAPPAEEGTRLERRDADLAQLAAQAGGLCRDEAHTGELIAQVQAWLQAARRMEQVALVSRGPGFWLAFLAALCVEWALRRRLNLV